MREKLARLAHKQWSGWMVYLFSKGHFRDDGSWIMPEWAVDRWQRQMKADYDDLPAREKESDRREADKFLAVIVYPEGGSKGELEENLQRGGKMFNRKVAEKTLGEQLAGDRVDIALTGESKEKCGACGHDDLLDGICFVCEEDNNLAGKSKKMCKTCEGEGRVLAHSPIPLSNLTRAEKISCPDCKEGE